MRPPAPLPPPRNPYRVLGQPPTADAEALKTAFRDLVRKHHPDHNPDDPEGAAERTRLLTAAYETVSDAERRKQYDAPWRRLRVPRDLAGNARPPGFFARVLGLAPKDGPGSQHYVHLDAGVTCFQYPGGELLAQAEVEFRKALAANPTSMESCFNLGLTCYWLGRLDEARTFLVEAARRDPSDVKLRWFADALDAPV